MDNRIRPLAAGYGGLAALTVALVVATTGLPGAASEGATESASAAAHGAQDVGAASSAAPGDAGRYTVTDADRAERAARDAERVGARLSSAPPPVTPPTATATTALVPAFAAEVPAETTQVVRTVRTNQWCKKAYCTKTEAWEKVDGAWRIVTMEDGRPAVFRSTIGPKGFAPVGKRREDDGRAPSGVFGIVTTFSTGETAPGAMPWRRRLPTSIVSATHNKLYNTWVENKKVGNGARPSMRYGFWLDYNHPRLTPGVGPAPVVGLGSGIFYHTARPGWEWIPTFGCTQLGNANSMAWVVRWLTPEANPRVVNNI